MQDGVVGIQQTIENNVPFGKLGMASTHAAIETGVSTANNIGELASAPGAALVMIGTVPAALSGAALSLTQDDFGQAAVHVVNAIPVMGPPMVKAISKIERLSKVLNASGGKRFSTRRHNNAKWPRRTMRKTRTK